MATINIEQLREAQATLKKYKDGKANLDNKLIENEDWWKLNHLRNFKGIEWEKTPDGRLIQKGDHVLEKRQSAWLFNSIMNKHADAMDNYPEPAILPRTKDDEDTAHMLSSVLPVILENCNFEQTYSDNWWDKLVGGSAIYSALWNPDLYNGLGDIEIRPLDMLNFYWEPGIQDIQESRNIFVLTLIDNKVLEEMYPELKGKLTGNGIEEKKYHYDDSVDTSDKSVVVDWYYKVSRGTKTTLQYVKFVNDEILYSSEDDEAHPEYREMGFYNHGKYPFVIDTLFREKGTPAGFGYVDVMKNSQTIIDDINADMVENAKWGTKPRFFAKDENAINQKEFQNLNQQIVHVAGSLDEEHIRRIEHTALDGNYLTFYNTMIDELKETSGNRDFSQGSTASGVTSGSAIAALQEAGSKGSRDMIKGAYRAFSDICELVIELIRQFYDAPRTFRITGDDGEPGYAEFDNSGLLGGTQMIAGEEFKTKLPVFDIKVKAQKSSPYARLSQNELALQFYDKGFFNPQLSDQALATIDMMDFEGKDKVVKKITDNGTMYQQMMQMQQTMAKMADVYAQATGDTRMLEAVSQMGAVTPEPHVGQTKTTLTDAMGQPVQAKSAADKMRNRIQNMANV